MISFTNGEKLITFIREHKKPIIIIASILIACFAFSGCKKHTHVYTETTVFPTCSEQGYTLHTCSCGESYKDNYQKPKSHTFDKYGICSACGSTRQIEVKLYVDGSYTQSVYTDPSNSYKIAVPDTPEDITSNPNSEKYFYGWFTDPNFQTPLTANTTFRSKASIYAKWITVYSNRFKYSVDYGAATITGYVGGAPTVLVIPSYINSFPVKYIYEEAFKNETVIRTVIICDGIETISGFNGCNSITEIRIPKSVKKIGAYCFANCGFVNFTIPDGITTIDYDAFDGCKKLTNITIPDSVTSIGMRAFSECGSLTSITIPNGVTSIGAYAFHECGGLTSITIPNGVTSIGEEAFRGCTGLKNITIPNSVTSIAGVFSGCTGLENITIPNSVTSIGLRAFFGCTGLKNITIPNSVTSIGSVAFSGCTGLKNITISNSVTSIGDWAFGGCSGLTNVTIPDSVTSIGQRAFSECGSLTSITIPVSVKFIGLWAFRDCTNLKNIAYNGTREQWKKIEKDSVSYYHERYLVQCTDGMIEVEL